MEKKDNIAKKILQKWKLIVIILIIGFIAFFFYIKSKENNKQTLTFQNPKIEKITKNLEVSGFIDAKQKAYMNFPLGGKIIYIGAKKGEYVHKGQTIASIDKRELNKQLKQNLNLYMKERWDWDQTLDDYEDDVLTDEDNRNIDKAQWDLDNSVISVELIDIALSNTNLHAPISGVLVDSPTEITNVYLSATDHFEIVDPKTLIFKAKIDEADIAHINVNQPAEINLDSFPDETIETYCSFIEYKSTQSTSGTIYLVEFPIIGSNGLQKYRLGMNGDIKIILDSKNNALTIPLLATRERNGKTYVDVKTGPSQYEQREIELGLESDEKVEVISGLTINDEVLIPE